ncbi:MAG: RimK family alpha-L-glutamate ligase [Rhodoferax sp.]
MNALMDLSTILQVQGAKEAGLNVLTLALDANRVYELAASKPVCIRLLAIMAPGDLMVNTPLPFLFENSDIQLSMLYLVPGEPIPKPLPEHDVAIIAVSDTSHTHELLEQLVAEVPSWEKPVLIQPAALLRTSRQHAFNMLQGIPGISMPQTALTTRAALEALAAGKTPLSEWLSEGGFPLIVRPVDSHAGIGLEKIDSLMHLSQYLETHQASEFYISPFVDYRSADGYYRKFRVVLVDGMAYAGHMAVSEKWMVHYLNAGMADSAWKRDEEERFMQTFESDFARRHAQALQRIHSSFGLEYLVMDCAETAAGDLLLFEVDPGAVIHTMDPKDMFPYKAPAMQKIMVAFRDLLLRTGQAGR